MDVKEMKEKGLIFEKELNQKKISIKPENFWYPYGIMHNLIHLDDLLKGENRDLLNLIDKKPILDIGSADGDLAFFLESLGLEVDIIDHSPTNFNKMEGIQLLKKTLNSSAEIHDIDIDSQFSMPTKNYGLILLLGTLYHLKNPFFILETLSKRTKYCLLSTRITKFSPDKKTDLSNLPVAYLVDPLETNNDPTNYWMFSKKGLERIIKRTGWEICDFMTVGNTVDSDPASKEGDERAFCLLKSKIAQI